LFEVWCHHKKYAKQTVKANRQKAYKANLQKACKANRQKAYKANRVFGL